MWIYHALCCTLILVVLLCLAYIRGGIFWPTYIRRSDVPVSVGPGRYSRVVIPRWRSLCGDAVWKCSKNLSVWRRERRVVARILKHILLLAIDPLSLNSLSLSLIVHCFILSISFICLDLIVCLTCVKPKEFYITPQLLFRGDSPESVTGNSATLYGYTKCVAISF